jgi:hypothetical protein
MQSNEDQESNPMLSENKMKKLAGTARAKRYGLKSACLLIAICALLVVTTRPDQQGQPKGKANATASEIGD